MFVQFLINYLKPLMNHVKKILFQIPKQQQLLTWTINKMKMSTYLTNPASVQYQQQNFNYFLILDFEATCDSPKQFSPMEIIEFPVLKVNGKTFEIEDKFHRYVRPTVNAELSCFCTQLTGILQEMVDESDKFSKVFIDFQQWLVDSGLIYQNQTPSTSFTFVTCGDWDLKKILPVQCKLTGYDVPPYMRSWINVKKSFADHLHHWPQSQAYLLDYFQILQYGRAHSGIDDCHDLAQVVRELAQRGYVFRNNSKFKKP